MDQELLLRNQYLLTENRLLRQQVTGRVCLTGGERKTLAEIGKRLGKQTLAAERWVRSVKEECLSRMILFGERALRYALAEYVAHYHAERPHQGKGDVVLMPSARDHGRDGLMGCRERLGGLLKYYTREAA